MGKRNFKLTIEYKGTGYQGWQAQNCKTQIANRKSQTRTIQAEIEKALKRLFGGEIRLIGSGRTDSGVHALGQIANFKCISRLDIKAVTGALNANLPFDIRILKTEEVPSSFHARFSAKSKQYRYIILNKPVPSVFYAGLCWWIPRKLDFSLMKRECKALKGKHNFKAFTGADRPRKSDNFVRTIKKISLTRQGSFIILNIEADGFLYNMARNIVGTLVEIGRGKFPKGSIRRILTLANRKLAGPTAPASGLFLVKVKY